MGWKGLQRNMLNLRVESQSAFAGYGLKSVFRTSRKFSKKCRNPLSLDMGWKACRSMVTVLAWEVAIRFRWIWVEKGKFTVNWKRLTSRNPLSLDMGWKVKYVLVTATWQARSQSAFAGYGLKREKKSHLITYILVAIRFRWIWVEKAVAIKHLKDITNVAIRFRWIWVEKNFFSVLKSLPPPCRNPLSLDMGWKDALKQALQSHSLVAIRFRWIWVEKLVDMSDDEIEGSRNPLSLDMGWKEL